MSVKPSTLNTELDSSILSTVVQNTSVKEPIWINNQTRLNESNMNNLRNRLISYSDGTLKSTYRNITQQLNRLVARSAGWHSFESTDGTFSNPIGAVFNDFEHNEATGQFSAAFGTNTKATILGQFVIGQYNATDDDAILIVGNGTETERSNVFVIDKNGKIKSSTTLEIVGKLSVSTAPTAKTHVVRKKELDALRDEISGALHYIGVVESIPTSSEVEILYVDEVDGSVERNKVIAVQGDIVLTGTIDSEGAIQADGNEYIFDGTNWTYYGAYANYVPKMEYEDQVKLFNQRIWGADETPTDGDTIVKQLYNERTARTNADKAINKAAFGTEVTPESIDDNSVDTSKHSLQKQITSEILNRENADKVLKENIVGNDSDSIEDNTLKGVINYTVQENKKITDAYTKKDAELEKNINTVIEEYQQADTDLKAEIIGSNDDTVENNTLKGVINEVNDINSLLNALEDTDVISAYPSISLETNIKSYEVGTTIIPSYKLTFVDGKYEYGTESETESAGCSSETWYAEFGIGPSKSEPEGEFESVHISDSTSIHFFANCTYSAGDIPNSDLGRPIEKSRIPAGKTEPKRAILSGYRQVFFGSTTLSFTLNSATIRGLALETHTKSTVTSFTMNIVEGAKQVLIAVPSNRKLTAVEDKNAFGTDILAKFVKRNLAIGGADATETDIGDYAKDYTLYIYSPDAALSANTYTVKLTNA